MKAITRVDNWLERTNRTMTMWRPLEGDDSPTVVWIHPAEAPPDQIRELAFIEEEIPEEVDPFRREDWKAAEHGDAVLSGEEFFDWLVERLDTTRVDWEER
jgi:hypothetical protein